LKSSDACTTISELRGRIEKFVSDRKWEKYLNPKNLAESICIEAAELLEIFQWVSSEEVSSWKHAPLKVRRVREELADVIIYCLSMANTMDIDIAKAVLDKLKINERRYPTEKFSGKANL